MSLKRRTQQTNITHQVHATDGPARSQAKYLPKKRRKYTRAQLTRQVLSLVAILCQTFMSLAQATGIEPETLKKIPCLGDAAATDVYVFASDTRDSLWWSLDIDPDDGSCLRLSSPYARVS